MTDNTHLSASSGDECNGKLSTIPNDASSVDAAVLTPVTSWHNLAVSLQVGDITLVDVDAIVNAANSSLLGGGGVDGAIHRAAGPQLLEACKQLRQGRYRNGLPVAKAVLTEGFNLPARAVIHTVGPNRHKGETQPYLLTTAFYNCLRLGIMHGFRSMAFPAISCGVYGWDHREAARCAYHAFSTIVSRYLDFPPMDVRFVLTDPATLTVWRETWEHAASEKPPHTGGRVR